jgi:hypothetical protein
MRAALGAFVILAGCEPPPPPAGATDEGPTIEILYPEPGQPIALNDACVLDTLIIVHIMGIELVPPDPANIVAGQGHWHGGLNVEQGYCASSVAYCTGGDGSPGTFDGTDVSPGQATLFASLRDNGHTPLGPQAEVEITVEDALDGPDGGCP